MSKRTLILALAATLGVLALSSGLLLRQVLAERDNTGPGIATTARFGAPFTLVDYDGAPITEAAFEGQVSLLFFGFTFCPEICPTTVYEMESWFRAMGPASDEVRGFFVTVDPERDRPEDLAAYLKPQSDRIVGISGPPEDVWEMARAWRVYWKKVPLGEGDYTMDHFASIYVLDRQGRLFEKISYGEDAESAIAKIQAALAYSN